MDINEKITSLIFEKNVIEINSLIKSGVFSVNESISLGRTALALASSCNYTEVMQCLIDNGADVNRNNDGDLGYTPLEEAAREGHKEAIVLLLEHNANIDKGNTINSNALIGASIGAHNDILKFLLEKGANINHTDNNGQTALHYICRYAKQWGSMKITNKLNGATVENEQSRFSQHTTIFNTLLEYGADVNLKTAYGYTPLHLTAESGTTPFIQPLIDKGALIDFQNAKGYAPLHAGADRGNYECCKILIEAGANIDVIDHDGFTPILGAVMAQNLDLVKLLVKKGAEKKTAAKVNYGKVSEGDTVLSLAEKMGNSELLALIK